MPDPTTGLRRNCQYLLCLLAAVSLAGCGRAAPTAPNALEGGRLTSAVTTRHETTSGPMEAENRGLAALRRATARYHDVDAAIADGFQQILPCTDHPSEGALGIPYARLDRFDATIDLREPEILFYEPQKNGTLHLVGAEPVIPIPLWSGEYPPSMFGREFHRNEEHGLFGLHMWIWRHSPAGMFSFWNPAVSCEFAS